jgi:hypothetical protein
VDEGKLRDECQSNNVQYFDIERRGALRIKNQY